VLDEPTASLSVTQTAEVLDYIVRLRSDDRSVIMVCHDLPNVFAVADRIVVMRLGEIRAVHKHVGDLLRRGHRGDRRRGRIRYDAVSAVRTGVACAHADCPRVASAPVSRWGSRWNHGMNELSCGSHLRCLSCSVCRAASNLRNLGRVLMGFCPVFTQVEGFVTFCAG
jgi:energy-coupling factor transporter ATP-binding protein EcfA2